VAARVFKRIANILDDAGGRTSPSPASLPALFEAEGNVEWRLWNAFSAAADRLNAAIAGRAYRDMFAIWSSYGRRWPRSSTRGRHGHGST
jgi:hypothetical protein